jgi:hypothetical protein
LIVSYCWDLNYGNIDRIIDVLNCLLVFWPHSVFGQNQVCVKML